MITIRVDQTLMATPADAWTVVSDLSRWAHFDPSLASVQVLGTPGPDAVLRCVSHRRRSWQERVVQFEPGVALALETEPGQLPFALRSRSRSVRVDPAEQGVQVTYSLCYQPRFAGLGTSRRRAELTARQTLEAMVHAIRERAWAHKSTVQSILNHKGSAIVTVAPQSSVREAAVLLRTNRIGTVLVLDHEQQLVGLVSERDIAYTLAERGEALLEQPVSSIMATDLIVCAPDQDMEFVMVCMTDRRIRHLPVLDGDALVGIISIGDVVRERIATLEAESRTMREYIQAREWRHHRQATVNDPDLIAPG